MAKTFTTVPDKSAGDVFTEAMWDTYVKDNGNNLISPPMCRVYNNAAISVANGTFQALTFNAERFDNDAMHSTSVNTGRITIATAGVYLFGAHVYMAANATGYRTLQVRLNGATALAYVEVPASPAPGGLGLDVATLWDCTPGDYVEFLVYQNSGGALNATQGASYSPEAWAVWQGKPT